ncbi:MAG: four helix bundle protein [Deltaproteobacteria bacterium]|nr:four helix bundle protein [Deltaproteobacteria bacterium]
MEEKAVTGYRDMKVWQKSVELVIQCYQVTRGFPKSETYSLASQIQRAAVSIPSNIAEGNQRRHRKEVLHHISIAYGSLAELETQMIIAHRLGYIDKVTLDQVLNQTAEIGKMLNGLRHFVEKRKDS